MLSRVVKAKTLSNQMSFTLPSLLFAFRGSSTPVHWGSMMDDGGREGEENPEKGIST